MIEINGRTIGVGAPPYMVAELSGNHGGDIARALALMEAAKHAGADAIKIQTYTADTITIEHDGPGFRIENGPWQGRTLHELYREAHTPWAWHAALFEKARELDITIFSSPFDASAVTFLEELGCPAYKVASFEIVDTPLIQRMAQTGKPLIISTGMASAEEVSEAVEAARRGDCETIALLHCTSGYPTPPEDSNLTALSALARRFDTVVGLSDHTLGITVPIGAVALGAAIIEKHVTLRRSDGGPDAAFSLEPEEFGEMAAACRTIWKALGQEDYGRAPSETPSFAFRRSIYVVADVKAGESLTEQNIRSIRPGYGLLPKHLPEVLGRVAVRDMKRGSPLAWDDITP